MSSLYTVLINTSLMKIDAQFSAGNDSCLHAVIVNTELALLCSSTLYMIFLHRKIDGPVGNGSFNTCPGIIFRQKCINGLSRMVISESVTNAMAVCLAL